MLADAAGPGAVTRRHLIVESHGPWRGPGCHSLVTDATVLARAGHPVTLHLVADGVHAAVPGALPALDTALEAGVVVRADRLSCDERALTDHTDARVGHADPAELADLLLHHPVGATDNPAGRIRDLVTVWH